MTERDIEREMLDGIREIKKLKARGLPELGPRTLDAHWSSNEIRVRLKLSREDFATLIGVQGARADGRRRQARRCPCHLPLEGPERQDLTLYGLSEERARDDDRASISRDRLGGR